MKVKKTFSEHNIQSKLKAQQLRSIYWITYSQVDLSRLPKFKSLAETVSSLFSGDIKIIQWACSNQIWLYLWTKWKTSDLTQELFPKTTGATKSPINNKTTTTKCPKNKKKLTPIEVSNIIRTKRKCELYAIVETQLHNFLIC